MTKLHDRPFEPVSDNDNPIEQSIFEQYKEELPGWQWAQYNELNVVEKLYSCDDFEAAMRQAQSVAELAESYDHHPMIIIEWDKTRIRWWTHTIDGVHLNDLVLAAKTEMLLTR